MFISQAASGVERDQGLGGLPAYIAALILFL